MAGKKLLVADDSATIQKVIRLALAASSVPGRDRHYEIQSVSDGNDLLRHLSHVIPDAILIDVNLPHKSAFEIKSAVDRLGPQYAHIRFVLLVGSDERIDDDRLKELGFSGVLTKPFEPSHLRQVLADALESAPAPAASMPEAADAPSPFPASSHEAPSGSGIRLDLMPPPLPSDSDLDEGDVPPPLPMPEDAPPPLPGGAGEGTDLWNSEEQERLENATRNIEIRLHAPETIEVEKPAVMPARRTNVVEEDIRRLAETTLRMSGFNESTSTSSPLEPSSIFPEKEMPPTSLPDDETGWAVHEPSRMSPRSSKLTPPPLASDLGGATFPRESLGLGPAPFEQRPSAPAHLAKPAPSRTTSPEVPTAPVEDPSIVPLSMDQMEQILERQLRATLQSMAEKMLPEIATRILKDEIHKMLTSENP